MWVRKIVFPQFEQNVVNKKFESNVLFLEEIYNIVKLL